MKELLSDVLCPNCKKPGIRFTRKPDDDLGFAARIVIECTNCMGYTRAEYSSQRIGEERSAQIMFPSTWGLHWEILVLFPKHVHCPEGASSWCFWQRAKSTGDVPGPHKDHDTLPPDVGSRLVPIFQRLSDEKLIQRCARKKTQNPNESLHQLIWKICPKSIYVGRRTLNTAVALAACQFSMGSTFKVLLLKLLGMEAGENLKRFLKGKDDERIKIAEKHHQKLQRSTVTSWIMSKLKVTRRQK